MYIAHYPYLQEIYHVYDDEQERYDRQRFLDSMDTILNQRKYVKVILLDWNERPLKEIQGQLVSGTLTKDSTSAVRRSCTFSATLNGGEYDVQDLELDFSLNKKLYLEIGVRNDTGEYPEYPILWFPQGMFFIASVSLSSSTTTGINLSIQCRDKMCLLNGDLGGLFPATTILDMEDTQDELGQYVNRKVRIYDIIQELVHHFGEEPMENIIIEGVDKTLKRVAQWRGDNPLYVAKINDGQGNTSWLATLDEDTIADGASITAYNKGDDIGYTIDDFYYTGDLTANAGQTICSVLDTIKNYLGNYEYYYDIYGMFHFQEIKNYLNNTQGKILIKDMQKNDYLVDTTLSKDLYSFDSNRNLVSLTVNPQYLNIKNDFIVQGLRKVTGSDKGYPVRYHLAIDHKPVGNSYTSGGSYRRYTYDEDGNPTGTETVQIPSFGNCYKPRENLAIYEEPLSKLRKGAFPVVVESWDDAPAPGNFNLIYTDENYSEFKYWDNEYKDAKMIAFFPNYYPRDWRTELYIQGLLARNNATDAGYYWVELESGWPSIYDLENQNFWAEKETEGEVVTYSTYLSEGDYFLDFIDPSTTSLGKFAVSAIGRRQFVHVDDNVNCLFQPEIIDCIYINNEADEETIEDQRTWASLNNYPFCQVRSDIYDNIYTGGYHNSAFEAISYDVMQHTVFQCTVTLMAIPADYMEPNTRVAISDKTTNTYGSYVITNISTPLAPGGNMSVTAREAFERY